MNTIYICSTLYQIIVAMQIQLCYYNSEKADIILTDSIKSSELLSRKISNTGFFDNVFTISKYKSCFNNVKQIIVKDPSNLIEKIEGSNYPLIKENRYKNILFANVNSQCLALAIWLRKKNKYANASMFEDGVATYSSIFGSVIAPKKEKSLYKRIKRKFVYSIFDDLQDFFVFQPLIMLWKPNASIKEIPPIEKTKRTLQPLINSIFNYDELSDSYSEKVIFFEESYRADGINVNDLEIISLLEGIYGVENVLIKTHPRNSSEIFEARGNRTNKDKQIPWEVIAMNKAFSGKVLVSMTSTAVINSFFLFDLPVTYVMEYSALRSVTNDRVQATIKVIDKINQVYPNKFISIQELVRRYK